MYSSTAAVFCAVILSGLSFKNLESQSIQATAEMLKQPQTHPLIKHAKVKNQYLILSLFTEVLFSLTPIQMRTRALLEVLSDCG